MDLRTYRARSLQEALRLVREDLGPDASVLHTREASGGIARWLGGAKEIEVTASAEVQVPSRLVTSVPSQEDGVPAADLQNFRSKFRADLLRGQRGGTGLEELCRPSARFEQPHDKVGLESLSARIRVSGPIRLGGTTPKVVALVGPTGVGKTTSIAKLAAHFAMRQHCRVGLITVDTYRIAAVEQLRTYAEIMDLPLEVVSSPREMREAVERLRDLDLILLDTPGRSPRDEIRVTELREFLAEASADEIILVLSAAAGLDSCRSAAEVFRRVGAARLLLTKVDEAVNLLDLLPLMSNPALPLCYITDGQAVPDNICAADAGMLAGWILEERHGAAAGGAR